MKIISAAKGTPSPRFHFSPQVTSLALTIHRTLKFGTRICLLPREGWGWEREERGAEWAEVNCGCSCRVGDVSAFTPSHLPFACLFAFQNLNPQSLVCGPVTLCHWQWLSIIGNVTPWSHIHLLKLNLHFNLKVQGGEDTPGWVGVGVGGGTALLSEQMLVSLEVIPGKRLSSRVVCLCFFLKPD